MYYIQNLRIQAIFLLQKMWYKNQLFLLTRATYTACPIIFARSAVNMNGQGSRDTL